MNNIYTTLKTNRRNNKQSKAGSVLSVLQHLLGPLASSLEPYNPRVAVMIQAVVVVLCFRGHFNWQAFKRNPVKELVSAMLKTILELLLESLFEALLESMTLKAAKMARMFRAA